jgi:hypothetical protein
LGIRSSRIKAADRIRVSQITYSLYPYNTHNILKLPTVMPIATESSEITKNVLKANVFSMLHVLKVVLQVHCQDM